MSLTRKVAFNSSVQMGGRLISTLIAFVSVKLLTSTLGPAGFGEYAAILNYIAFFGTMADFGFYWILVRELAKHEGDQEKTDYIMGNILAFRSVFALIVLACAVIAIYLTPTGIVPILTPTVKLGILVVAIATFWQTLNMTFVAIFQTNYRMDKPVAAEIIGRIVSLALLIPFLSLRLNVAWLVSAMVWGGIVNYLINVYAARQYTRPKLKWDFDYWRVVWKESAVLGVVSVLALVYFKIDGLLLSVLKTSTEVGIYAAPYKIIEILNFFPAAFMGIVFTALIQSWEKDKVRAAVLINRSIEAMVVLGLPVLVGGIILAGPIMQFITSGSYAASYTFTAHVMGTSIPMTGVIILQMLLIAVTVDFFGNIFGKGIIAFGSTRLLLWPNIIAVLVNIGLNLYLIPRWSYAGAALVTIITETIVLIIQIILISRFVRLHVPWSTVGKTLMALVVMAAVIWPLRQTHALIGLSVAAAVYLIAAWRVGAISAETVRIMLRKD